MSQAYTMAQRGGGGGDTGRRRAAILEQINSWAAQAKFHDDDKASRLIAKLNEAPERFINPDPEADYREEASRIWGDIKREYDLRTKGDVEAERRKYEEWAEAREEKRQEELAESELGGAPEPNAVNTSAIGNTAADAQSAGDGAEGFEPITPDRVRSGSDDSSAADAAPTAGPEPEPMVRYTRPLPAWAYSLPSPIQSVFATVWVLATFDGEPTEYTSTTA